MFEIELFICIKWISYWITYNGWYAIKRNPTNQPTCIFPFLLKSDFDITKKYRGITLTAIGAKVYNALLLSCIEKILGKTQISFRRNRSTSSQILPIHRIIKGERIRKSQCIPFYIQEEDGAAFDRHHSCKCVGQVHPKKMDQSTCSIRYSSINEVNSAGLLFKENSRWHPC